MEKSKIIQYCNEAVTRLQQTKTFGAVFVQLRMDFHLQFCRGFIFSTRFGASFFEDVLHHVETGTGIKQEQLGEFDLNFNKWLKGINKL